MASRSLFSLSRRFSGRSARILGSLASTSPVKNIERSICSLAAPSNLVTTAGPSHHFTKLDRHFSAVPGHRRNFSAWPSGGKVTAITSDKEFDAAIQAAKDAKKALVVDFTAAWCGPCKMVAPHYEQLAKDHPEVLFLKLDIDQESCQKTVQEANVTGVPAFQKYVSGKRVATVVGADLQRLKSMIKSS